MAIQYDKDKGEWGGFANEIYNSIKLKGASKESNNFFKMFENGDASSAIAGVLNTSSIDEYAESLGLADESLIKFLKDTDSSEKTFANYQNWIKKADKTTSSFGKKAGNVFKSFGATLGSMAVGMVAGMVVEGVTKVISGLNNAARNAADEAEKAAQKASGAYDEARSTYESLSDLTDEYQKLAEAGDWDNTSRERAREIQEEINKLVDGEITGLDDVKGKLSENNVELREKIKLLNEAKRAELEENATTRRDAYKKAGKAAWTEVMAIQDEWGDIGLDDTISIGFRADRDATQQAIIKKHLDSALVLNDNLEWALDKPEDFDELIKRVKAIKAMRKEMLDTKRSDGSSYANTKDYEFFGKYLEQIEPKLKEWETLRNEAKSDDAMQLLLKYTSEGIYSQKEMDEVIKQISEGDNIGAATEVDVTDKMIELLQES